MRSARLCCTVLQFRYHRLKMKVQIYVALVVLLGFVASHFIGRKLQMGLVVSTIVSIGLGYFLSFPLLKVTMQACEFYGKSSITCLKTDDQTVWLLACPLLVFPLYVLLMLLSKRKKSPLP
jgi:hypothetical protein